MKTNLSSTPPTSPARPETGEVERLAKQLEGYASAYDKLHRDIADDFRKAASIVRSSLPKELTETEGK